MKFDQSIMDNLRDYNEKVGRIRDMRIDVDVELGITVEAGAQAKRAALARAYREASGRYKSLEQQARQKAAERVDQTRLGAFKPRGGESAMMSYRDALGRLDGVTEQGPLKVALSRAYEVGDDVMAKAVLRRGYEVASEHLVADYHAKYPGDRGAWDEFVAAAEDANAIESGGLPGSPDKPPELKAYNVDSLAGDSAPTGT